MVVHKRLDNNGTENNETRCRAGRKEVSGVFNCCVCSVYQINLFVFSSVPQHYSVTYSGSFSGETDSKMTATAAAGKRVRDVTAEDWRKMTLMQKWKTSWNQDYADQRTSRMASRLGTVEHRRHDVTTRYSKTAST